MKSEQPPVSGSLAMNVDVDAGITALPHAFWQCVGEVRCELDDEPETWRPGG